VRNSVFRVVCFEIWLVLDLSKMAMAAIWQTGYPAVYA
jgi:hypothetical protein